MKAAVIHKPLEVTIEDLEPPKISPDEVLVKVMASGICGTDIHVYHGAFPGMHFPIVPGHEYSGQVSDIGSEVERIREGDHVIGEGSWGCGKCHFCRNGQANSCMDLRRLGRTVDGSFAEYVRVPARTLYVLPDKVGYDDAQSIMTLACVMHGLKRIALEMGETVAILGPGHVGLLFLQTIKSIASSIFVMGTKDDRKRLRLAEELGATATVDVTETDPIEKIRELTSGKGVDVVLEVSGSPTAVCQSVKIVRPDGRVLLFGTPEKPVNGFDATRVQDAEIRIVGSRSGLGGYESAIRLLASGKISVTPLISHRFPLEDLARGFEVMEKRRDDVVRVVVAPHS